MLSEQSAGWLANQYCRDVVALKEGDALPQGLGHVGGELDLRHHEEQPAQLFALGQGEAGRDRVLEVLGMATPPPCGGMHFPEALP